MDRRSFLHRSLALGAIAPLAKTFEPTSKFKKNIGIQIYTIRDLMQKDASGSIKAIAAAGYKNIELAGYNAGKFYGLTPVELKKLTDGLGMKIVSSHVAADLPAYFKNNTLPVEYLKAMDDAVLMGQKFFIWPFLMPAFRNDEDNAMRIAHLFNQAGTEAHARGLQFGYHNHAFEFDAIGNTNMMNIFLKETDPKVVKLELDLYWIVFANQDPVSIIKNNPGRFALYHVKDMAKSEKRESIEIGDGTIDFNHIFKETKGIGAEYFFVEQEAYRTTSLEAIKTNYKRICKLKF